MRTLNYNINVVIDLIALLVIGSVWLAGMRNNKLQRVDRRLFNALLLVITLIFCMDIPAWLLDGRTFHSARVLLRLTNTFYYALQIVYSFLWLLFAECWGFRNTKRLRRRAIWYALPMIAEFVLIFFNIKTGWIFVLDGANIYRRGKYFILNLIPYIIYIFGALTVTIHALFYADHSRRRQNATLLVFMFLPICGTVLATFVYGVAWLWPFTALSLLMVYLTVQQQALAEERINSVKREQDARVAIMLSQIQPHFLYNSLTAIYGLCETDPLRAQKAIKMFSEYLRFNMDSLKQDQPIPFATELSHIKIYTSLEKMRFDDLLHIVWDIQTDGFMIPSLTVQPLVENAVKYGVCKKTNGGTVTISTREYDDRFTVTVADDGVGFDPYETQSDGRTHIGIENVRNRLESMSHAALSINSEKGVGTTAVITIPKEKNT